MTSIMILVEAQTGVPSIMILVETRKVVPSTTDSKISIVEEQIVVPHIVEWKLILASMCMYKKFVHGHK